MNLNILVNRSIVKGAEKGVNFMQGALLCSTTDEQLPCTPSPRFGSEDSFLFFFGGGGGF